MPAEFKPPGRLMKCGRRDEAEESMGELLEFGEPERPWEDVEREE